MFDDLEGAKTAPSIAPKADAPKRVPVKPPLGGQNIIIPPLKSQTAEAQVEDMFAEVDKPAAKPVAGRTDRKKASGSGGGEVVIKTLVILVIFLILGIIGFVIANRFLGLVVFEGFNFLNKPLESPITKEEPAKPVPEEPKAEVTNEETPVASDNGENAAENGIENTETDEEQTVNNETASGTAGNIPAEEAGTGDRDDDGLTDQEEKALGTDMKNRDTDGDGLFDGDEYLNYKTNALRKDTDNDELPDGEEVLKFKTDPKNPDTDGDSYSDGLEVKNGYDPLSK